MQNFPIIYSDEHKKHQPPVVFHQGRVSPHPDIPSRVEMLVSALSQYSDKKMNLQSPISVESVFVVHDKQMIYFLEQASESAEDILNAEYSLFDESEMLHKYRYIYPDTLFREYPEKLQSIDRDIRLLFGFYSTDLFSPIGRYTWNAILHSANVAYRGAQLLVEEETTTCYSICRPSGHHAGFGYIGGGCYINNAAIAAKFLSKHGKVAIIDIDYHHGNGTQNIFWNDPKVLFCSIHADPKQDYPYVSGFPDEIGGLDALGLNYNIPLPIYSGDNVYLSAFNKVIEKVNTFDPSWLIISVGYDTHVLDPVGHFSLDTNTYLEIGYILGQLGKPTLFIQEGGYDVENIGTHATNLMHGYFQKKG